jgi:NADH-quinone oxidoreductase subunit C
MSSERVRPEEFKDRVAAKVGDAAEAPTVNNGTVELRVSPDRIVDVVRKLREDFSLGCDFFNFLSAIDWQDEGFEVLVMLTSTRYGPSVCVKVRLPADDPRMPSLTGVFRGANWHERETAEMFGIRFDGHPNLVKLYLPEDFEGYPLRKSFTLASRRYKPWPGEKEFEKQ